VALVTEKTEMVSTPRRSIAPSIDFMLDAIRRRIRSYLWIDGAARVVATLLACLLASMLLDQLEPPRVLRVVLLIAMVGAVDLVTWHWLIDRLRRPISDASLALLIERKFDRFEEGLLTAVEIDEPSPGVDPYHPDMLKTVRRQAERRIATVDLAELFDPRPKNRSLITAISLASLFFLVAALVPHDFGIWARRTWALSNELYPRETRLSVVGFEDGVAKVARGADFDLTALADTSMQVPRYVELRYQTSRGKQGRRTMSREGDALADDEPQQRYVYRFEGVLDSLALELRGGDARLTDLRIEAVEAPTLTNVVLDCIYPDYLARSSREVPVSGVMQLPMGTSIVLRGLANKDLLEATLEFAADGPDGEPGESVRYEVTPDAPRLVEFDLGPLEHDRVLLVHLKDTDSIRELEPVRVVLVAVPDRPPEVTAQLAGISSAVTPQARVPLKGEIRDDYAIQSAWLEVGVDERPTQRRPLELPQSRGDVAPIDDALEVSHLSIEPGHDVVIAVRARDFHPDPDTKQRVGGTDRFRLEVVAPDELLARLEHRELNLRRRFESIVEEFTDARNSLSRLAAPEETDESVDAAASEEASSNDNGEIDAEADTAAEGEPAGVDELADPVAALDMERLRVQRALQTSRKNSGEVFGLAEAFDEIYAELMNNRIDTPKLRARLKSGIADPLRHIGGEMFTELDRRLERLRDRLDDPRATGADRLAALAQMDATLVEMQQVLDEMIELETFSEVVDLLRSIIDTQQEIHQETQRRRRNSLRDLVD